MGLEERERCREDATILRGDMMFEPPELNLSPELEGQGAFLLLGMIVPGPLLLPLYPDWSMAECSWHYC